MEESFQPQDDIVILSDSEQAEKNSGRPFTDIWKYIRRGESRGNGHYEGKCNFCGKTWKRGKPASLRAHIANHCTGPDLPAKLRAYFIKIVANENEKNQRDSSDSEIESDQNAFKKQKITKKGKGKAAKINDHYQKKEKLNNNQIEEIDRAITQAFICCGIPFWIIENPAMINALKSLNANYDPPSRKRLSEALLENKVAKVNARVNRIIEKNENFTIGKYLYVKYYSYCDCFYLHI
jgi:hypothetical protein